VAGAIGDPRFGRAVREAERLVALFASSRVFAGPELGQPEPALGHAAHLSNALKTATTSALGTRQAVGYASTPPRQSLGPETSIVASCARGRSRQDARVGSPSAAWSASIATGLIMWASKPASRARARSASCP